MKKFIFLLLFALATSWPVPARADNANPPKIISVEQITTGPYSVGDIVTFKVGYEGGNPGIQSISISVNCVKNLGSIGIDSGDSISWRDGEQLTSKSGNGLISGYVVPCRQSELSPSRVIITDKTRLQDVWDYYKISTQASLKFVINKSDLLPTPVGEIKPPNKLPDEVDLGLTSKITVNQSFDLPRLTKAGSPLFYRVIGRKNCQIDWDTFLGDLGGRLTATSVGMCVIRVGNRPSEKYENPSFKTDKVIKPSKSSMVTLNFNVVKSGKNKR
jgi:hypothetical protein